MAGRGSLQFMKFPKMSTGPCTALLLTRRLSAAAPLIEVRGTLRAKGPVYLRRYSSLPASNEASGRPRARKRLVILGTGWGSYSVLRKVDKKLFDAIVISPRNHFLFTPLLASTTVGTLEFRSIIEPVRYYSYTEYSK